jgi:hypothetical protein
MIGLKKKIRQQELLIQSNRVQAQQQVRQLGNQIKQRMVSPLGLTSGFFAGFLFVYWFASKKRKPKSESPVNYVSILHSLADHVALFLSARRLFMMF